MRKITVYSTRGASGSFESDATTWGAIMGEVANIAGNLENLIATENKNKTNLGHVESVLPEGDFTIFLRPEKTKSGSDLDFYGMSFKELREYIRDGEESIKQYLNSEAVKTGRNWTQLSTQELQFLLNQNYQKFYDEEEDVEKEIDIIHDNLKKLNIDELYELRETIDGIILDLEMNNTDSLEDEFSKLQQGFIQQLITDKGGIKVPPLFF